MCNVRLIDQCQKFLIWDKVSCRLFLGRTRQLRQSARRRLGRHFAPKKKSQSNHLTLPTVSSLIFSEIIWLHDDLSEMQNKKKKLLVSLHHKCCERVSKEVYKPSLHGSGGSRQLFTIFSSLGKVTLRRLNSFLSSPPGSVVVFAFWSVASAAVDPPPPFAEWAILFTSSLDEWWPEEWSVGLFRLLVSSDLVPGSVIVISKGMKDFLHRFFRYNDIVSGYHKTVYAFASAMYAYVIWLPDNPPKENRPLVRSYFSSNQSESNTVSFWWRTVRRGTAAD